MGSEEWSRDQKPTTLAAERGLGGPLIIAVRILPLELLEIRTTKAFCRPRSFVSAVTEWLNVAKVHRRLIISRTDDSEKTLLGICTYLVNAEENIQDIDEHRYTQTYLRNVKANSPISYAGRGQ